MTVELTTAQCDLLTLFAHQPNVGFATIKRSGIVHSATQSACDLLYGGRDYDPQGKSLEEIEGHGVARELRSCIEEVCQSEASIRYQQVRLGRLLTATLWPVRDETPDAEAPVSAVIAMLTCAADTSEPGMVDVLKLTNRALEPTDTVGAGIESTGARIVTSRFASWGPLDAVTPRERDVLVWIGRGLSQKEIAEQMNVSAKTVETHRMRLGKKLHVKSASQLVRIACHSGIGPEHTGLQPHEGAAWMALEGNDVFEIEPPMWVETPPRESLPTSGISPTAQAASLASI